MPADQLGQLSELAAGNLHTRLLGAILGMTGAVIAGLAWAHASLSAMFGDVPLTDVLILLLGLPLVAGGGGWLFAGRKPPAVARQPIE